MNFIITDISLACKTAGLGFLHNSTALRAYVTLNTVP